MVSLLGDRSLGLRNRVALQLERRMPDIIPDLVALTAILWRDRRIATGVLVGIYAALLLTLDFEEMMENALEYVRVYKEGFSLKNRAKGFNRQFNQQHKGGDPAYLRGRYLVNKKEGDSGSLSLLGLHRVYFPAMFEIKEEQVGSDWVNVRAAVITFQSKNTLMGTLISLHIHDVASHGHWFKATSSNNLDIDITGKSETNTRDRWALYIEE